MISLRVVSLRDISTQAAALAASNFKEASIFKDEEPLEINWRVYEAFEAAGVFNAIGAYFDGKLVGYAAVIRTPSPHHKSVVLGVIQVVYLLPKYRKGNSGIHLIRFAERVAKIMGCTHMTCMVPHKQKRVYQLLVHLGYSLKEVSYMRKL